MKKVRKENETKHYNLYRKLKSNRQKVRHSIKASQRKLIVSPKSVMEE